MATKKKHGGKRTGAGRKAKNIPSTVIRIPLKAKDAVKQFVLDLEKRLIRNKEGKIKTIHAMPNDKKL